MTLLDLAKTIIHQPSGPKTAELLRKPGKFGLGQTVANLLPEATTTSVCGYCSTGCGLNIHLKNGHAIGLSPKTNYPVNLGMACPKGWEALEVLKADDRATQPLLRRNGSLVPVSWDDALDAFCTGFKSIQAEHGDAAAAFLSTGQIATEEMAFLGALAKFGMGMLHGDGNTRQCMATAVVAYKQAFGFDAPPYTYADYEASDVMIFWGANPCLAHPIMWERVMRNRNRIERGGSGLQIVTIDPRRTETAMQSTLHLPLEPKSDLMLAYGLANWLIDHDAIDHAFIEEHTSGFTEYAEHVKPYTLEKVSQATGLAPDHIETLAISIANGNAVSHWWTMGVNQSHEGVRLATAIIAISLMTGQIGKPGTGANSITGQANAMGSRLFSNTTNLLGGRSFESESDRNDVARILRIDASKIPSQNSLAYNEILDEVVAGRIKGLWVVATNPAHSWINKGVLEQVREQLDFLVVQDMYATAETAQIADLVLPAAGWGEKEGTFINSERRFGRHKRVSNAPGQALADFLIFRAIADRWGCGEMFERWTSPEAVFEIMQELSAAQPCDITGIKGYAELDQRGGVQWPWTTNDAERYETEFSSQNQFGDPSLRDTVTDPSATDVSAVPNEADSDHAHKSKNGGTTNSLEERRLFANGRFYHADGKAKFLAEEPRPPAEPIDDEYPIVLMTGRGSASQWHTQTRTSKSAVLRKLYPAHCYVEVHPADAVSLSIEQGDAVVVESRRARVTVSAFVTATVGRGRVFMPMHYPETNELTFPSFDKYSKQPSYKHCAVKLRGVK